MRDEHSTGGFKLEPGMVVGNGRFALIRSLGKGGMGEVFEAEDVHVRRRVALKVLFPHHAADAEMVRRFQREAQAVAAIVHPNVVILHDLGRRGNGALFIVQELLEGKNLRRLLDERGKLDLAEVLEILVPIMSALVVTHGKNIIHRDVKPENIFLSTTDGGGVVPKLIDFGVAKMETGGVPMTRTGVVMGTLLYVAPELLDGASPDMRVDVWGIGAVMFEMLAGRSPFDGLSIAEVMTKIREVPVPRIDAVVPGLPRELGDIVERALERDPGRRYGAMRDFLRAALALAERLDPAFSARHPGLAASAGLKSAPPAAADGLQGPGLAIGYSGGGAVPIGDETLELPVTPSERRPQWVIPTIEGGWEIHDTPASGLAECVEGAQQALRLNALQDAVTRAEQAIVSYHAAGRTRGEMRLVQAIAHRWLGEFGKAEHCADEARGLLQRGTSAWFAAVTHLATVWGYQGQNARVEALAEEVLPLGTDKWNGDLVSTLFYLAVVLVRGGAIVLAQRLFARARSMIVSQSAVEPPVRAALDLAHAEFALHEGNPTMYLRRVESALVQFVAMGDTRSACLQRANIANAYIQLGAYTRAEELLREAIHVGEPMKLMFITPARANLGFTLARLGDLEQAMQIERAALDDCVHRRYRRFEAISRTYLAEILSLKGEIAEAEAQARSAIEIATVSPAISAYARARLAEILLRQERVQEGYEHAKKAVDTLETLDGVEEGEALIRLVYVMALDAMDRPVTAHERLAGATQRLLARADRIHDPELKSSFITNVPENAWTFDYKPRNKTSPSPPAR